MGGYRHYRLIALLVTALLAVVAGCSQPSGAPAGTAASPLKKYASVEELAAAAQKRYLEDKTVRATFTSTVSQPGAPAAGATGEMSIRVDQTGTSARMAIQVTPSGAQSVELLAVPTAVYVKLPAEQAAQAGKPWIKIDPGGSDPFSRALAPALEQLQSSADPLSSLTTAGKTTIVASADDPVDGTPAVRYDLRVDLSQGNSAAPGSAQYKALGITILEPKFWLDAQDRMLKFQLTVQEPGGTGSVAATARYRDWGQPVDVTPPPADQIGTFPR